MSATYVAWNAKSYPWPPPEGWYLASDEQWWAPGTGPNPPPVEPEAKPSEATDANAVAETALPLATTGSAAATTTVTTAAATSAAVAAPAATPVTTPTNTATAAAGTTAAAASAALAVSAAAVAAQGERPEVVDTTTGEQAALGADKAGSAEPKIDESRPTADEDFWQSGRPKYRRRTVILVGLSLLVLAGIAGVVLGIVTGDGDDDETTATATATEVEAQPTTTTTTTTAPPSTTVAPAVETTIETVVDPERVGEFRARLDADGLSAEQLTDADIAEFGSSFCIFAVVAEDADSFDVFRSEATAENVGELNTDELSLAIDDAISVFCPDQAAKLGIS